MTTIRHSGERRNPGGGWTPVFAGVTKAAGVTKDRRLPGLDPGSRKAILSLCCAMLMSAAGGWVPRACAELGVPASVAGSALPNAMPVLSNAAPALAAGAASASPWLNVVQALPPAQMRDFYGVDLTRPQTLEAFTRVLDRTALQPELISAQTAPENIAVSLRSAMLSHCMDSLRRAVDMLQADAGEPFPEQARRDIGRQIDDLLVLNVFFPKEMQEVLEHAGRLLHALPLPKPEDLATLRRLNEEREQGFSAREDSVTPGKETFAEFRGRNGLQKSAVPDKPSGNDAPGKIGAMFSWVKGRFLKEGAEEADILLDCLSDPARSDRSEVLAALSRLPAKAWTDERKGRVREISLYTQDASLRSDMITLLRSDSFGLKEDGRIVEWLYPEAREEIEEFYPALHDEHEFFKGSVFADPRLFHDWVENARRAKSELSPEAYARLKEGLFKNHYFVNFFFPVRNAAHRIKEGSYLLPYAMDPLSEPEGKEPSGAPDFIRATQKASVDQKSFSGLRAKHALFDRLINANYQTLESMSGQAESLTRASAKLLLSQTRRMADLYHRLRGDSRDEAKGSRTQKAYERIKEDLRRRWQGLSQDEKLPEKPAGLVFKLDPQRPLRSLNSLINWMHQKALSLFGGSNAAAAESSGSMDIGYNGSLPFFYLGQAPLREVLRRNQVLRAFQSEARKIHGLDIKDDLFFDEHRVWMNLHLGVHSAELSADSSPPDEGGMLKLRYMESGYPGSKYRLRVISTFLEKLGMSVKVTGDEYLDAVLDKDHGLDSERSIAELYPLVIRFLYGTRNFDLILQDDVADEYGEEEAWNFSSQLGELFFSEGRWPFDADAAIYTRYKKHFALVRAREALAPKLNAELERLGLPPMPADISLGQRTIDLYFSKPILEAVARGELKWDGQGKPEKRYDMLPLTELAFRATRFPENSSQVAGIIGTLDASLLTYEPIGKIGALSAERAQRSFEDGSILTVLVLRDTVSGSLAYASALSWKLGKDVKSLPPFELLDFLHEEGLAAREGALLSPAQQKKLDSLLSDLLPEQFIDEQAGAYGLPAAPGKGEFVTGPILFDRSKPQEGAVLAVPYTSPDDMEALSSAAAVLTTGGGSLSHAAITTRELGIPSVILPSARWRKQDAHGSKPMLGLQLSRQKRAGRTVGVAFVELSADPDPNLREGDLVRVYGKEGKVALIARADDAAMQKAYAELEAMRSGAAAKFEWDPSWDERVERFLRSEAISNPRYWKSNYLVLEALAANAKYVSTSGLFARAWDNGADKPQPSARPSFWDKGFFELSQAPKPLWRALERRLSMAQDPDKKRRLLEVFHRILSKTGFAAKQGMDLLFVCTGNTCRSPMAEQITRQLLAREGIEGVRVASRGFTNPLPGEGMSGEAARALTDLGFTPEPHQVQRLSGEDVRSADVILTMSKDLARFIMEDHPEAASKVILLNRFAGLGDAPIMDPVIGFARPYDKPFLDDFKDPFWLNPFRKDPDAANGGRSDPWDAFARGREDAYHLVAKDLLAAARRSLGQIKSYLRLQQLDSQAREEKRLELESKAPSFLDLADIDDDMKTLVGGKSAKLGEMLQALSSVAPAKADESVAPAKAGAQGGVHLDPGLRRDDGVSLRRDDDSLAVRASVPEGLALTIHAYQRFLKENGLEDKVRALAMELDVFLNASGQYAADHDKEVARVRENIRQALMSDKEVVRAYETLRQAIMSEEDAAKRDRVDALTRELNRLVEASRSRELSRLSERIRQTLMSAKLDPEKGLGREILEALKKHGSEDPAGRWSVRSSAIQEDSDDAAFAGAAESYLNLKPEEILSKVVENWASFWLPRGILYRNKQGLRSADLLPATLIQKMAPAVVSGVIFTRNPVNSADEVVINAAYGLGEGVVSGKAAADVYVTRKQDGQETELPHVARKRRRVENRPEGSGTRLGSVPAELRGLRALTPEQTQRLTRVAVALEKRFKQPLDIEFSILADGRIVILQARPITT
ncbi:MAG: PEP/pyruvate-binding domain-containing protein [Elusimicrobiota bacterium]